jgi:hypothetical protein
VSVQPIDLDPPDNPRRAARRPDRQEQDADAMPSTTLRFNDQEGRETTLVLTPDGDGGLTATVVLNPDGDLMVSVCATLDAADVLRLDDDLVGPTARAIRREREESAASLERSRLESEQAYREKAFVIRSAATSALRHRSVMHRSTCPAVRKPAPSRTLEYRHDAHRAQQAVDAFLERTLRPYMSEANTVSRERWQASHPDSPLTLEMRLEPLHFCGTCKPLGEFTTQAGAIINRAAESASDDPDRFAPLGPLAAQISTRLWSVEQEHLDAVRGSQG